MDSVPSLKNFLIDYLGQECSFLLNTSKYIFSKVFQYIRVLQLSIQI
jgi:hypothetical protein